MSDNLPTRSLRNSGESLSPKDDALLQRAQEALQARLEQQAAIADLSQAALDGLSLPDLFQEATTRLAHALRVEYAKVLEYHPEREQLSLIAGAGWKEGYVGHATLNADHKSQGGYTLVTDGPVILENAQTESRFEIPPLLRDHGVVSGMSVVIQSRGKPWGVLGVHSIQHRTFTQDDVNLLTAFASILASAIDRKWAKTELDTTDGQLKESQLHYQNLIANIPGIVYRCAADPKWTMQFISEGIYDLAGYKPEGFVGNRWRSFASIIHPEDRKLVEQVIHEALEKQEPYKLEYRLLHADGSERWVSEQGRGVFDAEGELLWLDGVILDISQRKKAEQDLFFHTLVLEAQSEASKEGILVICGKGEEKILNWNQSFVDLWGFPKRTGAYENDRELLEDAARHVTDPEAFLKSVQYYYDHPDEEGQDEVRLKNGRILERYTVPVRSKGGVLYGRGWFFRDITEQKQSEEQRRRLTSQLILAEQRERRRLAVHLHDHIGQLLAASKLKLDHIRSTVPEGESSDRMKRISELLGEAIRNTRVITVELSPPVLYEFGLNAAVHWLAEQLHRQFDQQIFVEEEGEEPRHLGEDLRVLLFQTIRELLFNVIKHADATETDVLLEYQPDRLRISVRDNGVGFSEEVLANRIREHTVFGLYNVRERLQQFQGQMHIDTHPGDGTTVTIEAPIPPPPEKDDTKESS